MKTMCRAIFAGPQKIEFESVTVPEPKPGEVRVRLEGCGVCASNLPVWEGRAWFRYPFEGGSPGHEGWGTVDAIGAGVNSVREGDRVTLLSYHAYAEYDVAPENCVVKVPAAFSSRPFPGEPLGCAWNIFRRSAVRSGETVAIVGIGFLGALLTSLCSRAGARVIAFSRRPFALEIARRAGAAETISFEDFRETAACAKAISGEKGCDCVIEAVGHQEALDLATELTSIRGRLIIAGYHQDGLRHINLQGWNWRGLDVINAHERDPGVYIDGMNRAVDAVASGLLDPFDLCTHSFPLQQLDKALRTALSRPDGFMKAWVNTNQ